MYRCPECGTEYTVVPDACTVCGHETDASDHIDLFAKAAEQERKITAQQQEISRQQQERAKEHIYAQAPAQSSASAEDPRLAVLEQALAAAPDGAKEASGADDWNAKKGRSHTGLKLAAVGAAAAAALGGSAFWAYRSGKPAGFIRSTVGTFYLKDQDLWFQNGQTGSRICLKEEFLPLKSTRILFTQYGNMPRLNEMLYVSPDGNDFYFPKTATIGTDDCALMHCTADHPELAEEVARINLRSGDYNDRVIYTASSYSYLSGIYGLSANSYMAGSTPLFQMNLPYVVADGAVYYRNPDGEFCCTQNGETQVIAPFVERFWTMPDLAGVYYIGVPDYEDIREKREWSGEYIHTDYDCMNNFAEVTFSDGGETVQTRIHNSDYVLCRITPGNPAEQLVPERIEDWKPMRGDFTQYLYYTTYSPEEQVTQLRRYDFLSGTAETVYGTDLTSKIILLQDYPDGSCYFGAYKAPESEELEEWLPDPETRKLMSSENGAAKWYSLYAPMQDLTVFYQEADGEPQALPKFAGDGNQSVYSSEMQTNTRVPYISLPEYNGDDRAMHLYYRAQEVPVTLPQDTGEDTAPNAMFISEDGTRLFAEVVEGNAVYTDDSAPEWSYGVPEIRLFCGTLNGSGEVRTELLSDPDDDAAVLTLELENEPAEVLRVTYGDMYSGDEKIASGVLNTGAKQQPEYRQLCFIMNQDQKTSANNMYIDMNTAYCGTLMRRSDRKTETVAERVTDFVPFDKEQFLVICGEKGENGALHYCAGKKQYQIDTDVSNLIGLKTLAEKSLLDRLLS